ncbi:MAG: pH regulation protein F [Planctomycetes bacterium]|nr:pH regulation protein F [Planctomycetota bacterium]
MFVAAGVALVVAMMLFLARALLGPTVYDRILAMNSLGTKTVLLLALLVFIHDRPEFVDIALVYALVNFVATLALLKLVEHGRLS